jgi:hypothetical protein
MPFFSDGCRYPRSSSRFERELRNHGRLQGFSEENEYVTPLDHSMPAKKPPPASPTVAECQVKAEKLVPRCANY